MKEKDQIHTNDTSGVEDMVMDPANPNKLLVAMWQHRRTAWGFKSGGGGSGLYITYDAGKTFKKLGKEDGLPDSVYGRIGLTISKSDPNRIYALVEAKKNGLYRSDDGGIKWELVNSDPAVVTNRAFYFQDIRVDPVNENRVYNINQMISVSEDGGKSFRNMIPYSGIHPNHHAFWINPINPDFILDGNDGGMAVTHDRGRTWQFDEKLPVGQFYHINVDNNLPYNVMGGLQDNGSWQGPAYAWVNSGLRNAYWNEVNGGDGFDVLPDPDNADWVYSMSQGGELSRYNIKTGEAWEVKPPDPKLTLRQRFNWNAAIAQDPFDKSTIYYGSQFLNKSINKGASWEIISPDLTTNDSVKTDQSKNGGLSIDITGAENYCTILAIEPSSLQKGVIWVGTDDGNLQLTKDGGNSWISFRGKIPGMPVGCWIPQIRASRYHAGEAFVICNDYRRGDFKPYIFRTLDFGTTWTRLVDEQKVTGYALCMIQDPKEPNLIFVGTEQGLWVSFNNGKNFQQFKNGYPSVSTYDLAIQEREADLVIATFGRALWILDDIRPLRKIAAQEGQIGTRKLQVFDPPQVYEAKIKNPSGIDYSIWGTYEGENRKQGAAISFLLNKTKSDTGKMKIADSGYAKIYNAENIQIRSLKIKTDTGFNRIYWGMEEKGIRPIGSRRGGNRAGSDEPAGLPADPGVYKVVIEAGKEKDSAFVTVNDDPYAPVSNEIRDARKGFNKRINALSLKVITLNDRLTEADEIVLKVNEDLKNADSTRADSLRKSGKAIQDSIKNIRYLISGKPQEKQGYGNLPQVTIGNAIGELRRNVFNKTTVPGDQEEKLFTEVTELVNQALKKGNDFFDGKWKTYRAYMEATPVKLFKDYTPIN